MHVSVIPDPLCSVSRYIHQWLCKGDSQKNKKTGPSPCWKQGLVIPSSKTRKEKYHFEKKRKKKFFFSNNLRTPSRVFIVITHKPTEIKLNHDYLKNVFVLNTEINTFVMVPLSSFQVGLRCERFSSLTKGKMRKNLS